MAAKRRRVLASTHAQQTPLVDNVEAMLEQAFGVTRISWALAPNPCDGWGNNRSCTYRSSPGHASLHAA